MHAMAISLRIAMPIAVLNALVRAMAIAVLSALNHAMTISLCIAMPIAVRNAVRNAVLIPMRNAMLIASNFSIPYLCSMLNQYKSLQGAMSDPCSSFCTS